MDYMLENLGDERFQELCQALLAREFPDLQCFPVGQPDGGRDAIAWFYNDAGDKSFAVFQVKYVRKPLAEKAPHKWLQGELDYEKEKVKQLIPKGAKAYYLLTNVPGTAHRNTGSMDRCNALLQETLGIPGFCWWRDDINRRLDDAFNLKWTYPELLSGPDMLHLIVESGLSEDKERRALAIKTFVKAQYVQDETVRFKQIDLQNQLLSLFVDGPVSTRTGITERRQYQFLNELKRPKPGHGESDEVGGATMLLAHHIEQAFPMIVLEGAPGQGKSTLGQYVCQVYRMGLLQDTNALATLPKEHLPKCGKLPFRIDLRDLATWCSKKDPFSPDESDAVPHLWMKSLEAFMAAHVRHYSGGAEFTVVDLHAVAKLSAILLVLDGLDEVADLHKRKEVVAEVIAGISRLTVIAASLQVVVTSRPSVFGQALGFPEKQFPHFFLADLPRDLIFTYCERWLSARNIPGREAADVRRILKQKIEQPHIRDLARNPMQLAILLSLIHTQGSSLPDKRTALYDSYVDRFLSREAEKSDVVRENRQLLVNLHGHLAWILHGESQKATRRGSISLERLQSLIAQYLRAEDLDVSAVSALFTGMVDRIVFLVSRVQGTYEFEVQPLREYFTARHLYETAPYSPPGCPRRGTKPDRFDAIAKSSYWLNVTRFFAGCFSKGELPCLVDRLQELSKTEDFRLTNQPRRLASALLADYVFSQDKKSTREAVSLLLDGVSIRHPLHRRYLRHGYMGDDMVVLPRECGGEEFVGKALEMLNPRLPNDYAFELIESVTCNTTPQRLDAFWQEKVRKADDEEVTAWLRYGYYLGALPRCPLDMLEGLLEKRKLKAEDVSIFLYGGQSQYLEKSVDRSTFAVECLLNQAERPHSNNPDVLSRLSNALNPSSYSICFSSPVPDALQEIRKNYFGLRSGNENMRSELLAPAHLKACNEFVVIAERLGKRSAAEWASTIAPWDALVESARDRFGNRWMVYCLAAVSAGIRSPEEKCSEFAELLDHSKSLCRRTRYSRLRAGSHVWWRQQLEQSLKSGDEMFAALMFCSWASSSTILKLHDLSELLLQKLAPDDWHLFVRGMQTVLAFNRSRALPGLPADELPERMHERLSLVLGMRHKPDAASKIYIKYLHMYSGNDPHIIAFCERNALQMAFDKESNWPHALATVEATYAVGMSLDDYYWMRPFQSISDSFPFIVAKQIAEQARKYPRYLVYLAEGRCQLEIESKLPSVLDVSESEGWFALV